MHELDIILTLAGALTAALVFGLVAQKLRVSPIVGYLAAGVAIGPFTPGFVAQTSVASQFAELGVVLLMFGVGLNLHVRELLAVKAVALPGAALGMLAATGAGALVTHAFGWSGGASVVYGLAISVTSTVVLLRVFGDAGLMHAPVGHVAIGWLLVEDLFVVLVVVLLPILATSSATSVTEVALSVGVAIAKLVALAVFTLVFGKRAIPRLLAFVARTRSRELFTLTVLVMALGVAVLAAKLFGASMALGAFLAGLVVGQSEFGGRAASDALPMRDAFAVVFFVATGMLLDPARVVSTLPVTAATVAVVWTAKPIVAAIVSRVVGKPARSITLAFGLGQIGEFSFVLAALGRKLGVLPDVATQALVMTSIITITASPFLVRFSPRDEKDVGRQPPVDPSYRAIVVGYGPIGKSLVRLLVEYEIEPIVVEMNDETVRALGERGIAAVHGDASHEAVLERAGAASAGAFFFTSSAPAEPSVRVARALNPKMLILARSAYTKEAAVLAKAGASDVVDAERELALAFTERLLARLGASAEELDRARDRVRREVGEAS